MHFTTTTTTYYYYYYYYYSILLLLVLEDPNGLDPSHQRLLPINPRAGCYTELVEDRASTIP